MNNFNSYRLRVIAERDLLQKLYIERNTTRHMLNALNRLPNSSATSQARFRFLRLEAWLNEAISRGERLERRLSLLGSVARFDNNGNNTNGPSNNGSNSNTNGPNNSENRNNRNAINNRGAHDNNFNIDYISQSYNPSKYSFKNIIFILFFLWGSALIIGIFLLGILQFGYLI